MDTRAAIEALEAKMADAKARMQKASERAANPRSPDVVRMFWEKRRLAIYTEVMRCQDEIRALKASL